MNVSQVITRYAIKKTFPYSEDVTIMGMLWIMCIGVSLGCLNHDHLLINIIDGMLKPKQLEILIFVEDVFIFFIGIAMTWLGYLALDMNRGFVQSMIGFDEMFRYLPVVIGGILTSLVSIVNVWEKILTLSKEEKKK